MLDALRIVGPIAFGYLLGGVPFGVLVSRVFYRLDITRHGSGNTGATNVYRVLGWRAALAVAVLDVAKGAAPALVAIAVAAPSWGPDARDWLAIGAGLAAVAGHSYSPYIKLRGGKGVATAAGLGIVLMPLAIAVLLPVFAAVIALVRIVSVASLIAAALFPLTVRLLYPDRPALFVFSLVAALLVFWRHRSNIGRLSRGEEPRIGKGGLLLKGREALRSGRGGEGGEDE